MIKKILECVCVNCGKLKTDISNDRFKRTQSIRNSKLRFYEVWNICKAKNVCEVGEDLNDMSSALGSKPKYIHGGCGARQPAVRKDGLKLVLNFKAAKDEVFLICILTNNPSFI